MDELMLRFTDVSKQYRLGEIGSTTLRDELQRLGARLRGREDPTTILGKRPQKKGGRFMALDGISFDVKKGETVGVIGHNGAGKSTLLKLLCRVTAPTSGEIGVNGRIASMLEVGTGFHGELTGRENVYMNGAILGMTRSEISRKMDQIIEFSEMERFIDTPVKRYSSGMYVKLAFSVAAHLDSEIMVMDEVLAVGDIKFQQKCLGRMGDAASSDGRTVLYVSHNMSTVRQLCTRCIVLDHGRLIFDGDTEQAIAIYSDHLPKLQLHYDYRHLEREGRASRTVTFLEMDVLEEEASSVYCGDLVRLRVLCRANRPISDMMVRFEIFASDNTVVGSMFSEDCFSAQSGEIATLFLTVDTTHLTEGKYRFDLLAFQKNEFGGTDFADKVEGAMVLELKRRESDYVWYSRWWGHTRLHDLGLEKQQP